MQDRKTISDNDSRDALIEFVAMRTCLRVLDSRAMVLESVVDALTDKMQTPEDMSMVIGLMDDLVTILCHLKEQHELYQDKKDELFGQLSDQDVALVTKLESMSRDNLRKSNLSTSGFFGQSIEKHIELPRQVAEDRADDHIRMGA